MLQLKFKETKIMNLENYKNQNYNLTFKYTIKSQPSFIIWFAPIFYSFKFTYITFKIIFNFTTNKIKHNLISNNQMSHSQHLEMTFI